MRKDIEYESLKETVDEANEIISELKEENRKLNDKIIDLSADLGMFQNENIRLTEEIEKYWQLEQELGCSLEVVFKALEDGIVINEEGYVNSADDEEFNEEDSYYGCLKLSKYENDYFFEDIIHPYGDSECGGIGCYVKLSDYQKTWWLKEKEEEDEEEN